MRGVKLSISLPCPGYLNSKLFKHVIQGRAPHGLDRNFLVHKTFRSPIHQRACSAMGKVLQMEAEPQGMEREAQLLGELAEIPGISGAWVAPSGQNGHRITVQYGQRDLPANRIRKYLRSFDLPKEDSGPQTVEPSFPVEVRDVVLHSLSPSGKRQLVVRGGKDGEETIMEIWRGSRVVKETRIPSKLHGGVYYDNWFSIEPAWSSDETRIAYVAQAPPPEASTPEWGGPEKDEKQEGKVEAAAPHAGPKTWNGVGLYQEDWGELNTGKKVPQIFVLEVKSGTITHVGGLPEDSSAGQPVWAPGDSGLVFVAWPHASQNFPRLTQRLGIVFCVNRPCFLYYLPSSCFTAKDATAERLETGLQSGVVPKFSPDGKHLYFLGHQAAVSSGAHGASMTLERLPWNSKSGRQTVVRMVGSPQDEDSFPGLFGVPFRCLPYAFLSNNRLLVTTQWRSNIQILNVSVGEDGSGSIARSSPMDARSPSWILLAAQHGVAVAVFSGPRHPPTLAVAPLKDSQPLQWQPVLTEEQGYSQQVAAFLDPAKPSYEILKVTPTVGPADQRFEAVLLLNAEGSMNAPTVLTPHGGPHSAFPAVYLLSNAYLSLLGYNVIQVNYRGSLGFGEDALQSLPGNIGTHDVADCIAALDEAIAQGYVDMDRVAVIGGSHGGFLTGHLLGQHPQRFKAGVLRNPVLDLALMTQISDIPDWCFIEGFGSKEGLERASVKPTQEEMRRLTKMSPIHHISKVLAPMFFMLGAKDRRVVKQDAHQYVAALKAQTKPVETSVIVFPNDTHALDQPQTEFEQWVNAAAWLKKYV